jgi:hypothetical protein
MSGSSGKYWTQQIGARVRLGSPTEAVASVTVTVDGVAHKNDSNWWPANDGTDEVCFCTWWDESALPVGGPYTLVACDQNAVPSEAVTTPALTHFAEPPPEVTSPPPGGVVTSTAPSVDWVQFLGFEGENAPPVASQGVGVSGDSGCLWRQCSILPSTTSTQYGAGADPAPPPLQPGQVYSARVWEYAPVVPLEGAVPGIYVEQTGRVWAFVVYSPVPVINRVEICRGHLVGVTGADSYEEHMRTSVTDLDGWQDVWVCTIDPDWATHPAAGDCDGSVNEGLYTLNQGWGQWKDAPLLAGPFTAVACDSDYDSTSFVTDSIPAPPSSVPDVTYPANGEVLPETEVLPTFEWDPVPGADYIEVWVEDAVTGARLWQGGTDGSDTSLTYAGDPLLPGHRYRLQVRAWYPDQDPSDPVSARLFAGRMVGFAVYSPVPVPVVLYDFENWDEVGQWWSYLDAPVGLFQASEHATNGNHSLRIDLPAADPGTSGLATCWNGNVGNWSSYNTLVLDFYNPNPQSLQLALMLHDEPCWSSTEALSWTKVTLHPGANQVHLNLTELLVYDSSRHLDLSHIYMLFIDCQTPLSETTTIYCDYIRLEQVPDDPLVDAARNIWKFDFGSADSPRWPDFFAVSEIDQYPVDSAAKPFGWTDDPAERPRFSGSDQGPDDLCRDYVRRNCPGACGPDDSLNFRVDVPNGDYVVYAIARWGHCCPLPAGPHQIWAEDALAVNVPMDAATFYTTDYFYRGMDEDYPLRQPAWDTFVQPNYPEYSFTTTVTDGSLDLTFVACRVYAVIVYPLADAGEMATRIAGIDEERRMQFDDAYFVLPPQELTFAPAPGDAERGFAAWPVAVMDPCYPDTLPPESRPAFGLSTAGSLGERRAVSFAIRPFANLSDVSLSVSDLTDGKRHVIPNSRIECQYVRYLATPDVEEFGPGTLTWKPQMLQTSFPINVPAQVTKQLWLSVHVPGDAAAGTYTGSVTLSASSGQFTIPLTVQIWPFRLHSANDMSYGLYYSSPDATYGFSLFGMQDAADAMLRLDLQDMKRHGLNGLYFPSTASPDPAQIDPVTGHVGSLDFSLLDRFAAAVKETNFGGDWRGIGGGGMVCYANCILQNSSVAKFDTNFNAALRNVLGRIVAWQTSHNLRMPLLLVDEPRECADVPWHANFADTMQYCALAHQVPGLISTVDLMFDTCTGIDYTPIGDAIDELDTHPWVPAEHLISDAIAAGKPVRFYNTGGDLRFVYGFYQLKWPSDGAWEWHYNWLDTSAFDPFPYSPFNSQWHYTYPSPEGPVPTLKYEWASQGIADYRYAATLAALSKKARKTGTRKLVAWADQADALLQSIRDASPLYPIDAQYRSQHIAGIAEGPGCLTAVESQLEVYRRSIAQMILALPPQMRDQ